MFVPTPSTWLYSDIVKSIDGHHEKASRCLCRGPYTVYVDGYSVVPEKHSCRVEGIIHIEKKEYSLAVSTHLEEREVFIVDCLITGIGKEAEEGPLRAHTDANLCIPRQAWLWVRSGGYVSLEAE